MSKVVIIMGSESDKDFAQKIKKEIVSQSAKVKIVEHVASAHKFPELVLKIVKKQNASKENICYITIAGRSNGLSGVVAANAVHPVIACPPYSQKFSGADIYSSLRMPSGVGCTVTIAPEGAAIAAAKIFALENKELEERVRDYQSSKKRDVENADETVRKLK